MLNKKVLNKKHDELNNQTSCSTPSVTGITATLMTPSLFFFD
jgi:hypothetical protein